MAEELDTHNRALKVNLNPAFFGTFAEIGAGQEVARWFLRVGGAAGTVAKTISAYDMKFSDAIYGKGSRYVSRERLLSMLDHEYELLLQRLDESRGAETRFFVFADTVAARNFAGTNECHGWMGVRFQTAPRSEPSDLLLHVNMLDPVNQLQQQALGVLGVNLVYSSFFEPGSPEVFLESLFDDLSLDRLEIDVVELRGPAFDAGGRHHLGVSLVRGGLTQAVLYSEDGTLVQPSSVLRKRPLVIERGMFQSVTPLHRRMLDEACARLKLEVDPERDPLSVPELSVNPVEGHEPPDEAETVRRLAKISELNRPVLLTRFPEIYHLTSYLRRYTRQPLRFVFGSATIVQVLHERHYGDLIGGLLEALGRLLAENVKLYVYPTPSNDFDRMIDRAGVSRVTLTASPDGLVTAESIRLPPPVDYLYRYLRDAGWIVGLEVPDR